MINEIILMNGYGDYVWSAFSFTIISFTALYFVTKLQLSKEQKRSASKFDSLNEILTGPTLLAFSMNDLQSAAKLVKDFAAKEESFEVKGLSIGEGFLEPNELKALASLPTKEEAISMLLGLMQAPLNKLAGTLNEVPSQLVRTVNAVSQTKS